MRVGMHVIHQREIIKYIQGILRKQFWVAVGVGVFLLFLVGALVIWPRIPPQKLAVALVQADNTSGSGFLVSDQLVLTTARVVGKSPSALLIFPGKGAVTGRVLFSDAENDLALIQLGETDRTLTPLPLGDADATNDGEDLYIVGYPGETYSVTASTLEKKDTRGIQTTATSNPGNSGAPLIRKMDTTVIGMILSTRELGDQNDTGRHRAISINKIGEIARNQKYPIR
jgi:S1-C subfamily serine protease